MPDELQCDDCFPPVSPGTTTGPLIFDGERRKWTSPPVDGKVPVWSDAIKDYVYVAPADLCAGNLIPAGVPREKGPEPRKLPKDIDQPM